MGAESPDQSAPTARRRRLRRHRRLAALALLGAPAAVVLAQDVLRRADRLAGFDRPLCWAYFATACVSALFWGVLLAAAARRRGVGRHLAAGLFVVLYALVGAVQGGAYSLYHFYINLEALWVTTSLTRGLVGELPLSRFFIWGHGLLAVGVAVGLVVLARRWVRPRRRGWRVAVCLVPVAVAGVAWMPVSYARRQASTPDLIYFHAITGLADRLLRFPPAERYVNLQQRSPEPAPALRPQPSRPRNVLLILQEAVRADESCIAYEPDCVAASRSSNAIVPERMPLLQLRATSSSTFISMSTLLTGLRPTESYAVMYGAPLMWELAAAAGYDIAYWTSHHLWYAGGRLYLQDVPFSHHCSATTLDSGGAIFPGASDAALIDRVIQDWSELTEPFFAVVHLSNVHGPPVVDSLQAPFQPYDREQPRSSFEWQNVYRNAVYLSERAVARLLEQVRATPSGERTVVVYTSDHGESFHEHSSECEHCCTLYEEELHVPGWIDAPAGTLSEGERANLQAVRDELLTHIDFAPTLLDLMGLWDEPGLAPFRERMMGHPLTRSERTRAAVPITNVSWVWEYPLRNWGLLQGSLKVFALHRDSAFRCYDFIRDPAESLELGRATQCAALVQEAVDHYGGVPLGAPTLTQAGGFAGTEPQPPSGGGLPAIRR